MIVLKGNTAAVCSFLVVAALLGGCNRTAPDAANAGTATAPDAANAKRWAQYQETNKRDVDAANSSFERRQAQLAEKKRKASNP